MKIVIVGGTGLIGSKLLRALTQAGHEVVPASPSRGVDTITRDGLAQALEHAAVVIDVSNPPSTGYRQALAFFETSTRHLLAAEESARVGHHVSLSLVGTERLAEGGDPATTIAGYFRAKVVQESLVRCSAVPWTIIHATHSFESIPTIADRATTATTVRLPPVSIQPMAADDIADVVGRVALRPPACAILEAGGPERFRLDGLIERVLLERDDPREVLTDPTATYLGSRVEHDTFVPGPGATLGEVRLDAWLARTTPARTSAA
jgi:uncharacterized protein YbjT (DUF2867 family)